MRCTPEQAYAAELALAVLGWTEAAGRGAAADPERLAQLLAESETLADQTIIEGLTVAVMSMVDDLAQVLEEPRADVLARFTERFRTAFPKDQGIPNA